MIYEIGRIRVALENILIELHDIKQIINADYQRRSGK
jgi:hypothetical protein